VVYVEMSDEYITNINSFEKIDKLIIYINKITNILEL